MTATYGFDFARPRSRGARIARIDALATLLDSALVIPGTGIRFGLDGLIGLFPVVGDLDQSQKSKRLPLQRGL